VQRLARLTALALLAALVAVPMGAAANRMWIGFHDDPSFRWEPDRTSMLDRAKATNATMFRAVVTWADVAKKKPANPANPLDPAYKLDDVDQLVRDAQSRGMEVLLTIWGTPRWANGGKGPAYLPKKLSDLTTFARALAQRYSGRFAGYPYVKFYSVWNESNLQLFLAPQYDSKGRSVGPANYAKLYAAAYKGIKAGNSKALVGIGETASNGRDKPVKRAGLQDTHSPGKFAELLSKVRPKIKFDAWAHHPYPTSPSMKPTQKMRWPNVSLASLPQFEKSIDKWFGRKNIPIWITEYGHETTPDKHGITFSKQRDYLSQAFSIARKDQRVAMFIWFILADRASVPWQSGLMTAAGTRKSAYATFASLARGVDARNATWSVRGANPGVRISALQMAYYAAVGSPVGVYWELWDGSTLLGHGAPSVPLDIDGWVTIFPDFTPTKGRTYKLITRGNQESGVTFERLLTLVGK
jgi:hypothetical protein